MNAATRHQLDAIPTPLDQFGPLRACVVIRDGGYRVAWCHDGGRRKEAFGPTYASAREAAAAARHLNQRSGAEVAA